MVDYGGKRTPEAEMRRYILEHFGDNVLVGFYLAWTLTAVSMVLYASQVIDLGTKEAFHKLCFKMASEHPS